MRTRRLVSVTATILACGVFTSSTAFAWRLLDNPHRRWSMDRGPLEFYLTEEREASLEPGTQDALLVAGFDAWSDIPCADLETRNMGSIPSSNRGFDRNGRTEVTVEDHGDELGSGTLAATVTWSDSDVESYNGVTFNRIPEMDVIFNDGVSFGSPAQIDSPDCGTVYRRTDFLGVATHEFGHGIGFGHSCESSEACPDPILRGATMYWSVGTCTGAQRVPNQDDQSMMQAAYGFLTTFETSSGSERVGPTDLTVSFEPTASSGTTIDSYSWNFGDGSEPSSDQSPTHTFQDEGQYTVTLTVTGNSPDCGDFEDVAREVGYVLACDEPRPSFRYQNLGDGRVKLVNTTDLGAYGCVRNFTWELPGDQVLTSNSPVVELGVGSYSVTLTASGVGGETSFTESIDVTQAADDDLVQSVPLNCGVAGVVRPVGAAGVLGFLGFLGLGLAARRRRD